MGKGGDPQIAPAAQGLHERLIGTTAPPLSREAPSLAAGFLETVAYWYGLPGASLVPSDELKVGDEASEKLRHYSSPDASAPRDLTQGCSAIRVRVKFTPVNIPLFPGYPLTETAWSEIKYNAYCFVMPPMPE